MHKGHSTSRVPHGNPLGVPWATWSCLTGGVGRAGGAEQEAPPARQGGRFASLARQASSCLCGFPSAPFNLLGGSQEGLIASPASCEDAVGSSWCHAVRRLYEMGLGKRLWKLPCPVCGCVSAGKSLGCEHAREVCEQRACGAFLQG